MSEYGHIELCVFVRPNLGRRWWWPRTKGWDGGWSEQMLFERVEKECCIDGLQEISTGTLEVLFEKDGIDKNFASEEEKGLAKEQFSLSFAGAIDGHCIEHHYFSGGEQSVVKVMVSLCKKYTARNVGYVGMEEGFLRRLASV